MRRSAAAALALVVLVAVAAIVVAPREAKRGTVPLSASTQTSPVEKSQERGTVPLFAEPADAISGTVLDAQTGAPVAAARAACRSPGARAARGAQADAAGRFVFAGLAPGAYDIMAVAPGYLVPEPQEARAGAPALRFALERGETVEGVVYAEATGAPIAAAAVAVPLPPPARFVPPYAPLETDREGRFALAGVPPGEPIRLEARAPGFLARIVDVPAGHRDEVRIGLERGGRIRGRVVAPDGSAAAGARVWIFAAGGDRPARAPVRLAAGADGRFASDGLPPGAYLVAAESDAQGETRAPLRVVFSSEEEPPPLELALESPAPIEGRVVDAEGAPVPGAEVAAERHADLAAGVVPRRATAASAADGSFTVAAGEGRFVVRAVRAGFAPAERADVPGGERGLVLALAASTSAPVVGRLRGPDGRPVAGVPIIFERAGAAGGDWGSGGGLPGRLVLRTDGFGEIASDGVRPGAYTISFLEPGSTPETGLRVWLREVEVAADEPLDLTIDAAGARGSIAGTAHLPRAPDGGTYQVDLRPAERPQGRFAFLSAAKIADDGTFRFDGVPPDRYVVRVDLDPAAGGPRRVEAAVEVRAGERATVELRGP